MGGGEVLLVLLIISMVGVPNHSVGHRAGCAESAQLGVELIRIYVTRAKK